MKIDIKYFGKIRDIEVRKDLTLVDIDHDVDSIKEYFGNNEDINEFDGFFVKVDEGDYLEIYGFYGNIAYLDKDIYIIDWEY